MGAFPPQRHDFTIDLGQIAAHLGNLENPGVGDPIGRDCPDRACSAGPTGLEDVPSGPGSGHTDQANGPLPGLR